MNNNDKAYRFTCICNMYINTNVKICIILHSPNNLIIIENKQNELHQINFALVFSTFSFIKRDLESTGHQHSITYLLWHAILGKSVVTEKKEKATITLLLLWASLADYQHYQFLKTCSTTNHLLYLAVSFSVALHSWGKKSWSLSI